MAYLPRKDGRDHIDEDAMDFVGEKEFMTVLSRAEAIALFKDRWLDYYHTGKYLPTPQELGLSQEEAATQKMALPGRLVVSARKVGGTLIRHARKNLIRGNAQALFCGSMGRLWIMDTGCGNDLVPESSVTRGESEIIPNTGAKKLYTANGTVKAPDRVGFRIPELGNERSEAIILPQTPHVLSMGMRCVSLGYDFFWRGSIGENPYFITDKGVRHECEVHGFIPYFRTAEPAMPGSAHASDAGDSDDVDDSR